MKIYKVGGAVRDRLLSFQYHETDWVVIGSSPEEMINLGFTPVGRDFPVFLHASQPEPNPEKYQKVLQLFVAVLLWLQPKVPDYLQHFQLIDPVPQRVPLLVAEDPVPVELLHRQVQNLPRRQGAPGRPAC